MKKIFKLIVLTITLLCPSIVFASDLTIMPISTDNWGSSTLLESDGNYLLIDVTSGALCEPGTEKCTDDYSNENNDDVLNFLSNKGVRKFDLYLSHYHYDHFGGYNSLGKTSNGRMSLIKWMLLNSGKENSYKNYTYAIEKLYLPDPSVCFNSTATRCEDNYVSLRDTAKENGIEVITLSDENDERKWVSDTGGIYTANVKDSFEIGTTSAKVLHINKNVINDSSVKNSDSLLNNSSLVTMFTTKAGIKFLTAGDIEKYTEAILAKELEFSIKADIFKLNHHGNSNTSNTEEFLTTVNPKYAYFQYRVNFGGDVPYSAVKPAVTFLNNNNTNVYTSQVYKLYNAETNYSPTWGNYEFIINDNLITPVIHNKEKNKANSITINYIDEKTNKKLDVRTYDFQYEFYKEYGGQEVNYYLYDYEKTFDNYALSSKSDTINTSGVLTESITYNLYYAPIYTLTIKHVDNNGNILVNDVVTKVNYNEEYTTSPNEELLKTYNVEEPKNKTGTIAGNTTVVYRYTLKQTDNPITSSGGIIGAIFGLIISIVLIIIAKKRLKKIN